MGAAALATSGYPVDREFVAGLLGFDGPVENSYEAVASADFSAEYATWALLCSGHVSRFVHDLMFWVANEVAAIRLHPSLIQVSSIMPQKRNPVALEHLRAFTSGRWAGGGSHRQMHNVPFGDINDVNDDLQPSLRQLTREVADVAELLADVVEPRWKWTGSCCIGGPLKVRAGDGASRRVGARGRLVLPHRPPHRQRRCQELTGRRQSPGRLGPRPARRRGRAGDGQPYGADGGTVCRTAVDPVHFVAVRRRCAAGRRPRRCAVILAEAPAAVERTCRHSTGWPTPLAGRNDDANKWLTELVVKGVTPA